MARLYLYKEVWHEQRSLASTKNATSRPVFIYRGQDSLKYWSTLAVIFKKLCYSSTSRNRQVTATVARLYPYIKTLFDLFGALYLWRYVGKDLEQSKFLTLPENTHLHKERVKEEMVENLHRYTHIFTDREKRWLKIFVWMWERTTIHTKLNWSIFLMRASS